MKIAILILLAVLILVGIALLVYILIQRHRSKTAQWYRVSGTVIGQRRGPIPGLKRALILYRLPTDNRNSTGVTCVLTSVPKQNSKHQFDLMIRKDGKSRTHRILYPSQKKVEPKVQTIQARKVR